MYLFPRLRTSLTSKTVTAVFASTFQFVMHVGCILNRYIWNCIFYVYSNGIFSNKTMCSICKMPLLVHCIHSCLCYKTRSNKYLIIGVCLYKWLTQLLVSYIHMFCVLWIHFYYLFSILFSIHCTKGYIYFKDILKQTWTTWLM